MVPFFIELLNRMDIRVILSEVGVFIGEMNLNLEVCCYSNNQGIRVDI